MGTGFDYSSLFYNMEEALLGVAIGILAAYLILLILSFACYVMRSVALHRIGKRRGISASWMAWIPIAWNWVIGAIADDYDKRNGIKRKWRVLLLTLSIISAIGFVVFYVALIAWMVILTMNATEPNFTQIINMLFVLYGGMIFFILISSAQNICTMVCIYKIFESTTPKRSVLCFLLYMLVPMAGPICLLACSKKGYPFPEELEPAVEVEAVALAEEDIYEEPAEVPVEEPVVEAVEESIFAEEE